jgi:hypothetical protein
MSPFRVNLGGEGELPGLLNQQGAWVLSPAWHTAATGQSLADLCAGGHDFLICPNTALALPDECADEVITNSLPPADTVTMLGPTVQSSEVRRILKRGGMWTDNGQIKYVKP